MSYEFKRETVRFGDVRSWWREGKPAAGHPRAELAQQATDWLAAKGYTLKEAADAGKVPPEVWQVFVVARFERPPAWRRRKRRSGCRPNG